MNYKKILMGTTAAAMIFAFSIPAMAADTDTSATDTTTQTEEKLQKGEHKDFLECLVTDSIVSQETYDAMKTYMEENKPEKPEKEATTDEEIGAHIRPARGNRGEKAEDSDETTEDATVTDETAKPERRVKNGTRPSQTTTADGETTDETSDAAPVKMGRKHGVKTDMFDAMLEAGVITQTDYDAIIAYFA